MEFTKKLGLSVSLFFLSLAILSAQQVGKISGKVLDSKTGETILGATVRLYAIVPQVATQTDLDGIYMIDNVPIGLYSLEVTYVGYAKKIIQEVIIKPNEATVTDISLAEETFLLGGKDGEGVVVTAKRKQETVNAILTLQRNNIAVSDGISGEAIKRSPDRSTGEVLRRVSGVTIQDNKFPVVRGLSDRYNLALVNGSLLPSTETEKRAFSFDMFPSALVDNILVNKTATADMPGDFSGGLIQLVTKDIPEENFTNLQISSGINSNTQGKPFSASLLRGSLDWLGLDNNTRALPSAIPSVKDFTNGSPGELVKYSAGFKNDWGYESQTAQPNVGVQFSTGWSKKLDETQRLGMVLGLTYSRQQRTTNFKRGNFALRQQQNDYEDLRHTTNYLNGALFNMAYKINDYNKIYFKNTFNISTDDHFLTRTGSNFVTEESERSNLARYRSSQLLSSQLAGEHALGESKRLKAKWIGAFNYVNRAVPNQRQMFYTQNISATDDRYYASVPTLPSPNYAGKFFSSLDEITLNTQVDLTYTISKNSNLRGGLSYLWRDRTFDARVFGIVAPRGFTSLTAPLFELTQSEIFTYNNFGTDTYYYKEFTDGSYSYTATTQTNAAFVMYDGKLSSKLRAIAGVRFESYPIQLNSESNAQPLTIKETFNAWLPSLNFIYSLTEKSNLRLSATQTLSRPELRELSPFSYFDLERNRSVRGNPKLVPTDIYNFDLRYELFPTGGQVISASAFYKYFINPIEERYSSTGVGSLAVDFANGKSARNFGVELEIRKNLGFIAASSAWLEDLTVFSNLAYINSEVAFGEAAAGQERRALQGQSNYIANVGLQYTHPENGWGATVLFNQIGRRISEVGEDENTPHIYEAPRPLLDFQISKKLFRANKTEWGEIRFNVADILNRPLNFYQDFNLNGKFDKDAGVSDNLIEQRILGTNYNLTFNYKF